MSDLAIERQLQRLKYIDMCAHVLGFANRKLLMNRFDVKQAWATKDFSAYQEKTGDCLVYDHGLKGYKPADWFSPTYEHDVNDVVQLFCEGKQSIKCEPRFAKNTYSYAIKNVEPKLSNIYNVFRALHLKKKVEIEYISRTSGKTSRVLVPHSLIKTGCFVYVRGFDHLSGEFRSFKLNRIISSKFINSTTIKEHSKDYDDDWNKDVHIIIKTNNQLKNKEAIEFDHGLTNGKLKVIVKKALVMYFLMDWGIAPLEEEKPSPILFPLVVDSIKEKNGVI